MISKNYFNILVEQLFYIFNTPLSIGTNFSKILDLYLKDAELPVEKSSESPPLGDSSLLNCHKPPDVSE